MRTVRTKVYKFSELSDDAKQKAIEWYRRSSEGDEYYLYDEAHESVKEFHEIFGTKPGSRSWLDVRTSHLDDNLMNLKGLRLQKYIWNNFKDQLFSGKYYSRNGVGSNNYKSRRSNCQIDHSCELTGVCYDESLLQPIYEFLEWKLRPSYNSYMDFETLVNDCFASLEKDLEAELQARNEDDYIIEQIECNEYEFTREGRRF